MVSSQFKNNADIILSSKAVFTSTSNDPKPAAIAIIDNRIAAIGSKQEIEPFIGPDTQIYRFENEMIMPGFHDFHVHIMMGAILEDSVDLSTASSEEEAVEMVRRYGETRKDEEWIVGYGWNASYWGGQQLPHLSSLDQAFPDKPVILYHAEMHYTWVNSRALELCKVNRETENPPYGFIEKDKNGELTGILYERASQLISQKAFDLSAEKGKKLFNNFLNLAANAGVTSVNDMFGGMLVSSQYYELFEEFEGSGKLTTRIHLYPPLTGNIDQSKHFRSKYKSGKLQFSGLKQFIDGVVTSRTAYLTGPYADNPETCGELAHPPEVIKQWVIDADKEGFRMRFHAIGDGAVRLALDAFEEAQKTNGKRDSRHAIEHVEMIHPDDISRFKELGVIASMQPELLAQSERNHYTSLIGLEREPFVFPIKTIKNTGATVALGTDFPVAPINPLLEIYRAVTRVSSDGEPWHPQECISISEALKDYTISPAYGTFRESELGTLETGKLADLIVLDRNLFEIPVEEIQDAKVRLTIVDGKVVFKEHKLQSVIP